MLGWLRAWSCSDRDIGMGGAGPWTGLAGPGLVAGAGLAPGGRCKVAGTSWRSGAWLAGRVRCGLRGEPRLAGLACGPRDVGGAGRRCCVDFARTKLVRRGADGVATGEGCRGHQVGARVSRTMTPVRPAG